MDLSVEERILELKAAKLPRNLAGYIYQTGRRRCDFSNFREWKLYEVLYNTLRSTRDHEDFAILAARLLAYLDRHPPSVSPDPKPQKSPIDRKERRRANRDKRKSKPGLAAQFKKAKPSTADMIETWKSSPVIGLGLESTLTPAPRAKREDVKIDKHTRPSENQERSHILYAAGWSLNSDDSQT